MLQLVSVITTGGLLLFSNSLPIDFSIFSHIVNLINDSKNLEATLTVDSLRINYLYDAMLGLVYIIGWRKEIQLDLPEKLLKAMSLEFKQAYESIEWKSNAQPHTQPLIANAPDFGPYWDRAYSAWEEYLTEKETNKKMATFDQSKKKNKKDQKDKKVDKKVDNKPVEQTSEGSEEEQAGNDSEGGDESPNEDKSSDGLGDNSSEARSGRSSEVEAEDEEWESLSPRERFLRNQKKKSSKGKKKEEKVKEVKQDRKWDGKFTQKDLEQLDRSKLRGPRAASPPPEPSKYMQEKEEKPVAGFLDSDEEEEEQRPNSFLSKWVGKFKDVVGDKKITKEDLAVVLNEFKQKLMEKNVAQEVAIQVAEAVGSTLLSSKTKSWTSVSKTVKDAMKEALRKILTPKRKIDLVVEVTKEREKLKPYVIVFVGVNGVGKSTNLAKVAYKLKNAKLSVMLAACDNFRAGAVEQIQTHGRNLDIPVFQKGYKEEPAMIAYEAIKDATKKHIDAVLVDTAGRMQDNTPLMKELARLVKINKPNLVVFIGEALVGNDAVDQITKFNKSLEDESTETFKPQIDAILLSKFDTVDDKVGTALSLVYSTSKPILFVGVGQKYPNLKELNVSTVVHSLLS